MRASIKSPDANGYIDPPVDATLRQLPDKASLEECDVVLVPITRFDHFKFDDRMYDLKKPWVLVDYAEFGWDWDQQHGYLWGRDRLNHPGFQGEEWAKLDRFVQENPPKLTFQRELLRKDRSDKVLPIEYLAWLPEFGNDTKDDYHRRQLEVSYVWSRSHEDRLSMHAALFEGAKTHNYDILSDYKHVDPAISENSSSRKWLSVHVPHYARVDVRECQQFIRKSKITISMPGCGVKCFRHGEVCQDALMAIPENKLAWSYPWDLTNSIPIPKIEYTVDMLDDCIKHQEDLYRTYCAAMENGRNYRPEIYLRKWVIGNIEKTL